MAITASSAAASSDVLGRWFKRAPAQADEPHPPSDFDAEIQVSRLNLPKGADAGTAMGAIRRAVQDLPGACVVSVQHHPLGSADAAVSVFVPSSSIRANEATRLLVCKAVDDSLSAQLPPERSPATGFADAQIRFASDPVPPAITPATTGPPGRDPLAAMTDTALLTHLLGHVLPTGAAVIAQRAIARFGSYAAVLSAPDADLRDTPGLGVHSVAAIRLVHAIALRLARAAVIDQPLLDRPDALIDYLTAVLARESIEHFRILFLDADDRLRADEAQARGTVNHTPVYPREVVRRALELRAASLILVHNHPSGDPTPSADDLEMTARVEAAAAAVGLRVRDHIIIGAGQWLSFRAEGLLDS